MCRRLRNVQTCVSCSTHYWTSNVADILASVMIRSDISAKNLHHLLWCCASSLSDFFCRNQHNVAFSESLILNFVERI